MVPDTAVRVSFPPSPNSRPWSEPVKLMTLPPSSPTVPWVWSPIRRWVVEPKFRLALSSARRSTPVRVMVWKAEPAAKNQSTTLEPDWYISTEVASSPPLNTITSAKGLKAKLVS